MSQSFKKYIPEIVIYLLQQHSKEWNAVRSGSISYQFRQGQGYFIIFRTKSLGAKRLISAHILTKFPIDKKEWQALKKRMTEKDSNSISDGKYRYLFIPDKIIPTAEKIMAHTEVKVKSLLLLSPPQN